MLAIRTTSNCLEMPIALGPGVGDLQTGDPVTSADTLAQAAAADAAGAVTASAGYQQLASTAFLAFAVAHANDKFAATQSRSAGLEDEFIAMVEAEKAMQAKTAAAEAAACTECDAEVQSGLENQTHRLGVEAAPFPRSDADATGISRLRVEASVRIVVV